jgi:hypothetical protein
VFQKRLVISGLTGRLSASKEEFWVLLNRTDWELEPFPITAMLDDRMDGARYPLANSSTHAIGKDGLFPGLERLQRDYGLVFT